jgi:hypothetical protein
VVNADLSFTTRDAAEQAPARITAQTAVDTAVGMVAEMMKVEVDEAVLRLQDAARRAGISVERFAQALVKLHSTP